MKHAYLLYTGYGKTKLMLDKIMEYPIRPRVLLLSTKKIVETSWQTEIDKWYPGQIKYSYITGEIPVKKRKEILEEPTDILAMNVEMIDWYIKNSVNVKKKITTANGVKSVYKTDELVARFNMIIFDECSLFKSYRTNRFKNVKSWCYKIQDVFILSATPTPNNIEDLWSQIYLLDGGARLGKSITAFREKYANAIPMYNGLTRYEYEQKTVDYILTLVKDIVTSIPKPAQPLFPEPVIIKTKINPDPETLQILKNFKENYIVSIGHVELVAYSKNQMMSKINQIASGSLYDNSIAIKLNELKLKALQILIQNITTPVLVVYNYVFNKNELLKLPGAVLLDNTQAFEDWNNNKIKLGILSPFSVAHGLNLQYSDCQDIIWFSPIWDAEKWQQTNARVCRRGQTHKVNIRVLILRESFDDYAFDLVQTKFNTQYNNLQKLK